MSGYTATGGYEPAGIVHKGEFIIPLTPYPRTWYDRILPFKWVIALKAKQFPEITAQRKAHIKQFRDLFFNKEEK